MNVTEAIESATKVLDRSQVDDARLESELLLRHTLGIDRVQLYRESGRGLTSSEEGTFWRMVERRISGEPTAYIRGSREFYGLSFYVDDSVLVPRPESEFLVEKALQIAKSRPVEKVVEIGTGSGAIAITLALNLDGAGVYATDISLPALRVARLNCEHHGVLGRVRLLAGDMLEPLRGSFDIIVANLPYIPLQEVVRLGLADFEPLVALDGGRCGLEKINRLCSVVENYIEVGGSLLLEVGRGQAKMVAETLEGLFPSATLEVVTDLAGIDRLLALSLALRAG